MMERVKNQGKDTVKKKIGPKARGQGGAFEENGLRQGWNL
jgi:hypothetical protein